MLLVVGTTNAAYVARHKKLHPHYSVLHYELLRELILSTPAVATTTHVLTEASNLLRYCREPMRSEIMIAFGLLLGAVQEVTPRASDVGKTPNFVRLGLTDAALLQLDPEHFAVASADLDLIVTLTARGFEVVNFYDLLVT
jgi:hypothetical protein